MSKANLKKILKKIGPLITLHRWILRMRILVRQTLFQSRSLYQINYTSSKIYNACITKTSYKSQKKEKVAAIKTVIIIYSETHFDPKEDNLTKKHSQSSAANLARSIYKSFSDKDITYLDKDKKINEIPRADLIIGVISHNFIKICKANPQAEKVLFLVNSHPLYRAKVLLEESRELRRRLYRQEWVNPLTFLRAQKHTDKMILIGNEFVRNTYINQGVDSRKLFLLNSGVNLDFLTPDFSKRPSDKIRVIYSASDLGIRKGLFRVMQYWESLNSLLTNNLYELKIVGGNTSFHKEIKEFAKKFNNVEYLGWIDSSTEEYRQILQSSHIIIFPSIEEGQAGTVLEAMACGCVPIITEQSGVPITDEKDGFVIKNYTNASEFVDYLNKLSENRLLIDTMSARSRDYTEKKHSWNNFIEKFKNTAQIISV